MHQIVLVCVVVINPVFYICYHVKLDCIEFKSKGRNTKLNPFLFCPYRRTPMTVEELLLYLSLPLSFSPASPSWHLSPDDGQRCCFTHSHIKEEIGMNQEMCLDTGHLKWIFKKLILNILLMTTTNLVSTDGPLMWFLSICYSCKLLHLN